MALPLWPHYENVLFLLKSSYLVAAEVAKLSLVHIRLTKFLSYDFLTAVNRIMIAQGSSSMIAQSCGGRLNNGQDARTSSEQQSYELQESHETFAKLSCDHRKTVLRSQKVAVRTLRLSFVLGNKMHNLEDSFLTTFLKDGNPTTTTETCIHKEGGVI